MTQIEQTYGLRWDGVQMRLTLPVGYGLDTFVLFSGNRVMRVEIIDTDPNGSGTKGWNSCQGDQDAAPITGGFYTVENNSPTQKDVWISVMHDGAHTCYDAHQTATMPFPNPPTITDEGNPNKVDMGMMKFVLDPTSTVEVVIALKVSGGGGDKDRKTEIEKFAGKLIKQKNSQRTGAIADK